MSEAESGPAGEALHAPAAPRDVVLAYRLLLGRAASAPEVAARAGQTVGDVLRDIAGSAEHRDAATTPLLSGAPLPQDRYPATPDAETRDWLLGWAPEWAGSPLAHGPWRPLLRLARLALRIDPPLLVPPPAAPLLRAPADDDDVRRLYRLCLGRAPESLEAAAGWVGRPRLEVLVAMLASDEFREGEVVRAAQDRDDAGEDPLPIADLRWARALFDIDADPWTRRPALLAALLGAPAVAAALAQAPLAWSPAALIALLGAEDARSGAVRAREPAIERIQRLSRNVELTMLQDVQLAPGGALSFASEDPAVFFRLDDEALADAPAVELAFALSGARPRPRGALYIDYGEGVSEAGRIDLTPRGRRLHHALVLHPARVRAVRWDPDEVPGEAAVVSIAARAVPSAELQGHLARLSPEELYGGVEAGASSAQVDLDISRRLTQRVHGHGSGQDYAEWIAAHEPSPREAQRLWAAQLSALEATPTIAVLVPLYNTPAPLLRDMIESVLNQVYPHWELCLADDCSPAPHVREIVERYQDQDPRIKCVFRPRNGHISEASNSALELVTADWFALLDHDDLLTPDALLAVAQEIGAHPDAQFIYSDEDKLDEAGARFTPFFKPDFSPELLRAQNYLNHLSVHRTANVRAAGGWRTGFEGSQDYDLNLRTLERLAPAQVRHIPRILYHWRAVAGSTALAIGEKDYAVEAGLRALREHLQRMEWDATAGMVPGLPFYRVRYATPEPAPLVSVIIPTRDRADLLAVCVDSVLERTDYPAFEIVIADNGSQEPATFALFERLTRDGRVRVVDASGPFNYSRINNQAVGESRGQIVALLNNDIEVITPDWMREMASWAAQPRIGCVGAKLYYPNDTIQHAGVILGIGGVAGHSHKTFPRDHPGYFSRLMLAHDISAVTGACLFVRREVWDEVGGLNEALTVAFNDVDFCLRVREAGYRNVFTPVAELYHHESPSRGAEDSPEKVARFGREIKLMMEDWSSRLAEDPFYSRNLTLINEDFSF